MFWRGPTWRQKAGTGVGATIALAPAWAWAQTTAEPYGYGPGMMSGMMWGWPGMLFGPVFMILPLVVVIVAVVVVVRWIGGPWHAAGPPYTPPPNRTALDILKERFARGEIDRDEFEERRRLLGD